MTRHRLTALLALVVLALAVTAGSALAGGDHGNGGANGNSANAPGQQKQQSAAQPAAAQNAAAQSTTAQTKTTPAAASKHESKQSSTTASSPATGGSNTSGIKPSSTTKHDTFATASSDQTKLYGNGKTAGQIAISAGASGDTVLHGPGNSQPHKTLCGGHEVDVHALAHKLSKCGTTPPAKPAVVTPSAVTPSAVTPSAPAVTKTAVVTVTATSPAVVAAATSHVTTPAKPAKHAKPAQAVAAGGVKGAHMTLKPKATPAPAGGVLGTSTRLGSPASSSTLPFTGLPLWIFALVAASLLGVGLATRHASRNRI